MLPSSSSLPELGPLSSDCLPEALPCRPLLIPWRPWQRRGRTTSWSPSHRSLRIARRRKRLPRMSRPCFRPLNRCRRLLLPLSLPLATSGTHAATWFMWPCEQSLRLPAPNLFLWTGRLSGSAHSAVRARTNWTRTAFVLKPRKMPSTALARAAFLGGQPSA